VVEAPSAVALAPPPRPPVELHAPRSERGVLGNLAGLIRAVRGAPDGRRHTTLFWAACRAGSWSPRRHQPRAAAAALVQGAMDGGGRDRRKAEATARDGIARGMSEGRRG
jgi:hypothetical protein